MATKSKQPAGTLTRRCVVCGTSNKKRQGRFRAALKAVNRRHGKTLKTLAKEGNVSPAVRREVDALLSQDCKLLKRLARA